MVLGIEFVAMCRAHLPKPIYLTFDSKEEGVAYCARLEALLHQGIAPQVFLSEEQDVRTVSDLVQQFSSVSRSMKMTRSYLSAAARSWRG